MNRITRNLAAVTAIGVLCAIGLALPALGGVPAYLIKPAGTLIGLLIVGNGLWAAWSQRVNWLVLGALCLTAAAFMLAIGAIG